MSFYIEKLPERPYNSLMHYIQETCRTWYKDFYQVRGKYPCVTCRGLGKVRDEQEYDAYEGWKMAGWYTCPTCQSRRFGPKSAIQAQYNGEIKDWKEHKNRVIKSNTLHKDVYKRICSVTTKAERAKVGLSIRKM